MDRANVRDRDRDRDRGTRSGAGWIAALAVIAVGCGGEPASPADAGSGADAAPIDDAAIVADARADEDAGPSDAGSGTACEPACAGGRACLRGVCVATCGADVAALEGALAVGLTPIVHACDVGGGPFDAIEVTPGGALRVYALAADTSGTTTTFTLTRFALDAASGAGTPETIATATHEGHAMDAIFVGGYLDVSPDESGAIFGYTTTDAGFVGGVLDVEVGDGTTSEVAAPGNYDAAWLDADRWLVSGQGLGAETGAALYLRDTGAGTSRTVVGAIGAYNGSVARAGDVVLAGGVPEFGGGGWPDGTAGDRVFVLDADAVIAATTPLSAWDDALARLEAPSSFEVLGGMRLVSVVYDGSFMVAGFESRTLSETDGAWEVGAPEPLVTGGGITSVVAVGDARALLVHAGGALLVSLE